MYFRRIGSRFVVIRLTFSLFCLGGAWARAQDAPFDLAQFEDLTKITDKSIVNSFVQTVGLLTMDRPYQPASPLGRESSWELGLAVTLVKLNDTFKEKLNEVGGPKLEVPALPMPYLQVQKGLGDRANFGISYVRYKIFRSAGAHLQVTVFKPEEGPVWAIRLALSSAQVGFVEATTWAPQVVMSRPLDFAESYLGLGYAYAVGGYRLEIPQLGLNQEVKGSASSAFAFTGVKFKVSTVGLKLGIEGGYSTAGAHSMGLALGLVF